MTILIDLLPLDKGGGVQVAYNILSFLQYDKRFKIICIVPDRDDFRNGFMFNQMEFYYFKKPSSIFNLVSLNFELLKLENKLKPDLVYCIWGPSYWVPKSTFVIGFALGTYLYESNFHLSSFEKLKVYFKKKYTQFIYKKANIIIVETKTVKERLSLSFRISSSKIEVVPNSLNNIFLSEINVPDIQSLHIESKFIFVPAAYYPHKNFEIFPKIIKALLEKNSKIDIQIYLTVRELDVCNTSFYDELIKDNLLKYFKFLGPLSLDKMSYYYKNCICILFPSLVESFSAVFLESFFFKKILLVNDLDFSKELDQGNCILITTNDFTEYAKTIDDLLASPSSYNFTISPQNEIFYNPERVFEQRIGVLLSLKN